MADDPKSLTQQANYEILKNSREEMEKIKSSLKEINSLEEKRNALSDELKRKQDRLSILKKDEEKNAILIFDLETQINSVISKRNDIAMQEEKNLKLINQLKMRYGEITEDNLDKAMEALKLEEERLGVMNDTIGIIKGMTSNMGDFGKAVGKIGNAFTKAGKDRTKFMEMGQSISKLGKEGSTINKFGNIFTQTFSKMSVTSLAFVGIAGMVIGKVFSISLEIDKLSKSFQKSTGFVRDFSGVFTDTAQEVALMGATSSDVSSAFGSMSKNLSSFSQSADATNKSIAKTVITLQQFGVTAEKSTNAMNFFEKGMGMSSNSARKLTVQIATMGTESDITMTQMMDNFDQAKERISMFGSSSTRVLRDLSIQAKASGMSVSSLLGISKKFDTFSEAAEAVSQLNSVLGTNLSSMQMLEMDDAQRIEMLRKEVKARVGNFQSLDKHTKMYIQNALGVQSVAEAQKLIDMNPQQYAAYNSALAESAVTQEKLAEQAQKLVPLQDSLKVAFNDLLMELVPVTTALVGFLNSAAKSEFVRKTIVTLTTFATVLGSLVVVGKTVAFVLGLVGVGAGLVSLPIWGTVAAVLALGAALWALWEMWHKDGSPMLYELPEYFGKALGGMGDMAGKLAGALKNPIKSLSSLWDIFHKEGSPELYKLPQEFADNFASIEESVAGTMSSITNFISVMKEFASLDYDGFVAVRSDGGSTSMVMGSEGIIKQMSEGRLTVDVNMPEIKMPPININVTFNDNRLKDLINVEIAKKIGRAV